VKRLRWLLALLVIAVVVAIVAVAGGLGGVANAGRGIVDGGHPTKGGAVAVDASLPLGGICDGGCVE
jgi:hypothetical protein